MSTFQQLVIAELMRDRTPRTCSEIEAEVIERSGVVPPRHAASTAINAIGKKSGFEIRVNRAGHKFTYSLISWPEGGVPIKPAKPAKPTRMTLAEISQMFDRLLWAVRQGRGQA
ncbi:hypothetical protein [Rahnella sp. WP5]|uniref:hypothetical protein n=1 Tax=Rahnella sp. WP5 TaxID=1500266 RepID=UPI00056419E4|nr:hypothetical protein [Rahnella sp. WP5]